MLYIKNLAKAYNWFKEVDEEAYEDYLEKTKEETKKKEQVRQFCELYFGSSEVMDGWSITTHP